MNDILDGIINRSVIKDDLIVYRGIDGLYLDNNKISNLKVGQRFNDKAHVSTSAVMTHMVESNHDIILELLLPKGTHAAYIEQYTGVAGYSQQEVLLGRNNTFEITGKRYDETTGKMIVQARIVTNETINKYMPDVNNVSNRYNSLYQVNSKVSINNIFKNILDNGLVEKYNNAVDDMLDRKLYDGKNFEYGEHDFNHVKNVLLYSLYLGNNCNLSEYEMTILTEAAKFHDSGVIN